MLGVNVGRAKGSSSAQAAEDYRATVRRLAAHADYLALNVSSPNTPGLRDLQAVEPLRGLVAAVREELAALGLERPVLVKIAPDLADEDVDAIADLAIELGLDGIIATNTTVDRSGLRQHGRAARGRDLRRAAEGALAGGAASGCAPAPATGSCSSRSAGSRTPRTPGRACGPARPSCRRYTGFVYGGPGWAAPRQPRSGREDESRGGAPGRSRTCIPRLGGACSIH